MLASVRAGVVAALVAVAPLVVAPAQTLAQTSAQASEKPFARPELADAAIRLEAQIKKDAGSVGKPLAQLRREADAAFQRNDVAGGMVLLGQIVAVAPQDAANWLRLARAVRQLKPANARERNVLIERAAAAAYIAYQRAGNRGEEADGLVILGQTFGDRRIWRPALDALRLSLDLREEADVRVLYERMRETHGFRLLDYSVDSDAASPRACFQFSEDLPGKRTDFSPFVAVAGMDRPALSADERQLCVEGLRHGERYSVTLRAGLPSTVRETLPKSVEMSVYVRDRKPFARFASRAYVLPRTGQRGIPVVSVNTDTVEVAIYRIGDRALIDTVLGRDFQRGLSRYEVGRLADTRGSKVWSGELSVERQLNAEVTTAFPVESAVGDMAPGVYLMTAEAKGADRDEYGGIATQWFVVSDLGLAAYSGSDGIAVFVNSLASAEPKGQVEVRLMSRGNEVLATQRSDAAGRVRFEAGLVRGEGAMAPAMLIASEARGDYGFLSLRGPAFDLTDRGVAGRVAPAGLDAFVYTERGVYRSGETVHITALLRDAKGVAAPDVPVTLAVVRPDGLEYRRVTVADQGLGGRSLSVAISSAASTGTWRVNAYTDPKLPPVGETTFLVEDYVPDRLEFELAAPVPHIARNAPAELTVEGRYLYGAPASELNLEGELIVAPARERPGFAGYRFGLADEDATAERYPIENMPQTDAQGRARIQVRLDKAPDTTGPLEATAIVRMAEPGGRAVERRVALPVLTEGQMIGVRPLFSGRSLGEGENATFDVVMASPDGKTLAAGGLRYELLKVERRYQWYRRGGSWGYESIRLTRRIADGRIDVAADQPGRIALPVQWGRYRLEVSTGEPNGPVTSVAFDAGWYTEASADTPDVLEIALDKPEYRPGETMNVAVTARTAGRVTLDVMGERLLHTVTQDVQPGTARIRLNVGRDWGTGAYVVATLRRPLDRRAQRMPGRAIGVQWFAIDRKAHTLALDMALPAMQRPNSTLRIPVKIDGLASGEDARIVVAAVDLGILNLTNYQPPAPDEHYLGQKRLGTEIRDLYGQLIDGMQGAQGRIRTGGDGPGADPTASPPSQKPLALYSGIVAVKPDGTAEIDFEVPAFAGTVRVMAVAWSRGKVGRASGDVTVRDPVVLTATLPRFLLVGDRSSMHLDLDNVDGPAGEYRVLVRSGGIIALGEGMSQTLTLRAKQRRSATVPLTGSAVGDAGIDVRITGPDGLTLERSYALAVKPATQVLTRRTVRTLASNEALTLSSDLFSDLVPGTGSVAVSAGPSTALDAATLLRALDRYPFGCSEQIVSRALPLLYVNDLASEAQLALDNAADRSVRDAIDRVMARQSSNGAFGLWGIGGGDAWLDAYVTDFLTRARERGFAVPDAGFRLALDRLRNVVAAASDPGRDGGNNLAYALYVLARNGVAPLGDLRYLADAKLNDLATPIAKAQVAAALGLLGDRVRAERVYRSALADIKPPAQREMFSRADYGSTLRDAAALVTLAAEAGGPPPVLTAAVQRVEEARGKADYTSTQENAWLVLAARALAKDGGGVTLDVAGAAHRGPFYRTVRADALGQGMRIANTGDGAVQAVVSVSGAPTMPEPAAENGFSIERQFFTLDGEEADPAKAARNQRFVVVLKVTEPEPQFGRVLVADYLPAGFEIDNPRLVSSGDTGSLPWIAGGVEPEHVEFRDDRFTAAFNRSTRSPVAFSVAYVVRAVAPGRYVLPQAYVEDMYRPDRFGRTETGTVEVAAK